MAQFVVEYSEELPIAFQILPFKITAPAAQLLRHQVIRAVSRTGQKLPLPEVKRLGDEFLDASINKSIGKVAVAIDQQQRCHRDAGIKAGRLYFLLQAVLSLLFFIILVPIIRQAQMKRRNNA